MPEPKSPVSRGRSRDDAKGNPTASKARARVAKNPPNRSQSPRSSRKRSSSKSPSKASPRTSQKSPQKGTKKSSQKVGSADVKTFYTAFVVCASFVAAFFYYAPALSQYAACGPVSLPWMVANVRDPATYETMFACATQYRAKHEAFLLTGFCLVYVLLQSFAIPGPIVLSVLAGALYPFLAAHALVAVCATTGATICYLISSFLGNGLIHFYNLESKMVWFKDQVANSQKDGRLPWYMFLTRVTPVPNVLINIASPLVGVPVHVFALSTLAGLIPLNAVHISTGYGLASLGTFNPGSIGYVLAFGTAACGIKFLLDRRA